MLTPIIPIAALLYPKGRSEYMPLTLAEFPNVDQLPLRTPGGVGQKTAAVGFTHAGKVDPLLIAAAPFAVIVPIGIGNTDMVIVFPVGLVSILIPSPATNVRFLPVDESEVTFFILTVLLDLPSPEEFVGTILYQRFTDTSGMLST